MQPKHLVIFIATLLMVASSVIAQDTTKTIVENVASNPNLKMLNMLISANEGIGKVFNGKDPVTVLAPSDQAISDFGGNFPKDPKGIESVLRYHIVNKAATVDNLAQQKYPNTVLTEGVKLPDKAGQVVVVTPKGSNNATISDGHNEANIIEANLDASNGVIHVIDTVLTPPKNPSDTAEQDPKLSTFVNVLKSKDLVSTVNDEKEITIFAPSNEAFDKLPKSTIESDGIKDTIKYHVVKGVFYARAVENGTRSKTLQGDNIIITLLNNDVFVNDAKVVTADMLTNNGVIHVIDTVLDPKSTSAPDAKKSSASSNEAISGVSLIFICFTFLFLNY